MSTVMHYQYWASELNPVGASENAVVVKVWKIDAFRKKNKIHNHNLWATWCKTSVLFFPLFKAWDVLNGTVPRLKGLFFCVLLHEAGQICSVPLGLLGEEPDRRDSAGGDAIRVTDLASFSLLCRRRRPSCYLETHWAHPSQSHHTSGLLLTPAASGPTFNQWGLFIASHLFKLHVTLQVGRSFFFGPLGNRPGACGLASGGIFPHVGTHVKSHWCASVCSVGRCCSGKGKP